MAFPEAHASVRPAESTTVDSLKAYRNAIERFPDYIVCSVICAIPRNTEHRYNLDPTTMTRAVLLGTFCD